MLLRLDPLTLEDFRAMEALERRCYAEEHIAPAERAFEWYCRYPYTAVAAADGEGLAGFVNLFPVHRHVYSALLAGTFDDSFMTADDIADIAAHGGVPHLFLSCIAIEERYRGTGLSVALLSRAAAQFAEPAARCEAQCAREIRIVTDNVTQAGERFSQRCGLSFVRRSDHGSSIYEGAWADFLCALRALARRSEAGRFQNLEVRV